MKHVAAFISLAALIVLAGCASAPKFETPADLIGASYATIIASSNTVVSAYEAGRISKEEAQKVKALLEDAYALTAEAQMMLDMGKPVDAIETLRMAQKLLAVVESKLQEAER